MKPKLELAALVLAGALGMSLMSSRLARVDHGMPSFDAEAVMAHAAEEEATTDDSLKSDGDVAPVEEAQPVVRVARTAPSMSSFALARLDAAARVDDWRAIDAAAAEVIARDAMR
jgi:hypothetical protein